MDPAIQARLTAFRSDLPAREVPDLVQRHVTSGDCYALPGGLYIDLKQRVAAQYGVHHTEVLVVGSAKMGFSIVPTKRYHPFGESSDIDVALCSEALFDAFWTEAFDFWARGETWSGLDDFRRYIFRGWMRPDKLPPAKSFALAGEWWEFFRALTASGLFGQYKLRGALYKSWHFLETYQQRCIRDCKRLEEPAL
jgi:hypothetical protein